VLSKKSGGRHALSAFVTPLGGKAAFFRGNPRRLARRCASTFIAHYAGRPLRGARLCFAAAGAGVTKIVDSSKIF